VKGAQISKDNIKGYNKSYGQANIQKQVNSQIPR
jgi:hypothetical protein